MSPTVIIVWLAALAVMILFPIALAVWFQRRARVRWPVFFYGAAVFVVFQLFTRIPALAMLGSIVGPAVSQSRNLLAAYIVALGLSAGLFESVGRWAGYRWLFRAPMVYDWQHGVAYGIGHGGIESILLVGVTSALNLIQGIVLTRMDLAQLEAVVPAGALEQIAAAREQLLAVTWSQPVWAAYERLCTIPFHVAMSLLVLFVFVRRQPAWLWVAVAAHGMVDAVITLMAQYWRLPAWAIYTYLSLWAGVSLWFILWARGRTASTEAPPRRSRATPERTQA